MNRMIKRRKTAVMLVFVLSAFASASLYAQGIAPVLPNKPVTITGNEEAQLQNEAQPSEQAQQASQVNS